MQTKHLAHAMRIWRPTVGFVELNPPYNTALCLSLSLPQPAVCTSVSFCSAHFAIRQRLTEMHGVPRPTPCSMPFLSCCALQVCPQESKRKPEI